MSEETTTTQADIITDKKKILEVKLELLFNELGLSLEDQILFHQEEYGRLMKIHQSR